MPGNPELIEFIRARIVSGEPVPFRWFMEQALYHPRHGYYASGRAVIGRRGDFFTNVSVGALFGKLLARQFLEMWEHLGRPDPFTLVEQGANTGEFAADVLTALRAASPGCFDASRYVIVEPFAPLRERQETTLRMFPQVGWRGSLAGLEPFCGVHFSNELIDAMPVHLVRFAGGAWHELCVNDRFELVDGPLSSGALEEATTQLPRIENYRTELNLDVRGWIEELSGRLTRGYVLAIDYGFPRDVYYSAERAAGTIACHSRHQKSGNPLENAGLADITAHVDFTGLAGYAEKSGFTLAGYADQHHFMVGLGSREFADAPGAPDPERQKSMRAFKTLMHPGFMGLAFKAIALRKGVGENPLQGFAYSSDARSALGLAG